MAGVAGHELSDRPVAELPEWRKRSLLLGWRQLGDLWHGLRLQAREQLVSLGDQSLQWLQGRVDDGPDVAGEPRLQTDPALVGAVAETSDRAERRILSRVQLVPGLARGHMLRACRHGKPGA